MSLFDTATLSADTDLTSWESRMPELGQKSKNSSGSSPFDGKRVLAKSLNQQVVTKGQSHVTIQRLQLQ
jgi:hypothetical protein